MNRRDFFKSTVGSLIVAPFCVKETTFVPSFAQQMFYGGARGGGKTLLYTSLYGIPYYADDSVFRNQFLGISRELYPK